MKIIFGLGNPGCEYENTRHNVGFMFIDYLSKNISFKEKFNSLCGETNVLDEKILLVKPLKYINLSGEVVLKFMKYYKLCLDDILVIHDDLDMIFGKAKFTYNHSSGGHNGIKNICENIKSNQYLRLKIGIGKDKNIDTKDYVLNKFNKDEICILNNIFVNFDDLIKDFVTLDRNMLMNKYNKKCQ